MNSDIFGGAWKQLKGKAQQMWGDLTNDELDQIQGKRTEFEGLLQKKYGYSQDRAAQEVDDFMNRYRADQPVGMSATDALYNSGTNDVFSGSWKQLKGKAQQMWGDLTDDELDQIQGKRTEFEGLLQKKYGYTKQRASQEVDSFLTRQGI